MKLQAIFTILVSGIMMSSACVLTTFLVIPLNVPSQETVEALVEQLRSDSVDDRERAAKALLSIGESARPLLEQAARGSDSELAARAQGVLESPSLRVAEKLLEKMEAVLKKASTVQLDFTCRRKQGAFDSPLAGSVIVAQGNKASIRANGTFVDNFKYSYRSDGKRVRERLGSTIDHRGGVHDTLYGKLCFSLARMGIGVQIWLSAVGGDLRGPYWRYGNQTIDIKVKRLGATERVEGRSARPVLYTMIVHASGGTRRVIFDCTVWIDRETFLPLKRIATCVSGDRSNTSYVLSEVYSKYVLGKEVDPGDFKDSE